MKATFQGAGLLPRGAAGRLRTLLAKLGAELDRGERVGILFTDDAGIRVYNARHRRRDEPTDVLSFGSDEPGYLGDLVISVTRARAQADELGHSTADEIEVLVLHGVLHLLGHDHETDGGRMRRLEARLARRLFGGRRGLVERAGAGRDRGTKGRGR